MILKLHQSNIPLGNTGVCKVCVEFISLKPRCVGPITAFLVAFLLLYSCVALYAGNVCLVISAVKVMSYDSLNVLWRLKLFTVWKEM